MTVTGCTKLLLNTDQKPNINFKKKQRTIHVIFLINLKGAQNQYRNINATDISFYLVNLFFYFPPPLFFCLKPKILWHVYTKVTVYCAHGHNWHWKVEMGEGGGSLHNETPLRAGFGTTTTRAKRETPEKTGASPKDNVLILIIYI